MSANQNLFTPVIQVIKLTSRTDGTSGDTHHCNKVRQVGFHRTVPLVLHGTGGIGRTHRIEGVGGTNRIP